MPGQKGTLRAAKAVQVSIGVPTAGSPGTSRITKRGLRGKLGVLRGNVQPSTIIEGSSFWSLCQGWWIVMTAWG